MQKKPFIDLNRKKNEIKNVKFQFKDYKNQTKLVKILTSIDHNVNLLRVKNELFIIMRCYTNYVHS